KKIALSHPCNSKEERDSFLEDFDRLAEKYNVRYYAEDQPFLSDLFPVSMNRVSTMSSSIAKTAIWNSTCS
ncbi:MAG: hypothetical protein IIY33_06115, partial [Erysipelotrichaceae bacterium]|nr:hypothetical protein [Erysipelotrichaceae bacterium]